MKSPAVLAAALFLGAAPASAAMVETRVDFQNQVTGLSVKAVVQNVEVTQVDSFRGTSMKFSIGVGWLKSAYAVFVANFEGLDGPHNQYCVYHIEIRATNPFTGPAYVDECKVRAVQTKPGRSCVGSADRWDESQSCQVSLILR